MHGGQTLTFRATARGRMHERDIVAFREQMGRDILRIEMMPLEGHPIECDMTIRALPELGIARGALSRMRNHHPEQLGDDGVVLALMERGEAELTTRRGSMRVRAGEAVITANEEAATFTGHTATRVTNIRLRRQMLTGADPMAKADSPLRSEAFPLQLLLGYAQAMTDPALGLGAAARQVVISNIYDLALLAIGGARDVRAHMSGLRAAHLHALKSDTLARMSEPALSLEDIAKRHGISASYARKLFAADGTAFFEYLREQRLAAAHRRLRSTDGSAATVSAIAYEVGFGDLSYFNRAFRQRYGMTPTDVRALARER